MGGGGKQMSTPTRRCHKCQVDYPDTAEHFYTHRSGRNHAPSVRCKVCWRQRSAEERLKNPLYQVWYNMRNRCDNPKSTYYDRYGGRDIRVCGEWCSFEPFKTWALMNGWRRDLEIDRCDNDGPYSPANCRFVTRTANVRNSSRIVLNPELVVTIREIREQEGIGARKIAARLNLPIHAVSDLLRGRSWRDI